MASASMRVLVLWCTCAATVGGVVLKAPEEAYYAEPVAPPGVSGVLNNPVAAQFYKIAGRNVTNEINPPEHDDACECLHYEDVFKIHSVTCSEKEQLVCQNFLMRLPKENFCIKYDQGMLADHKARWCYVSNACSRGKDLEYGLPFDVMWRQCLPTEPHLGDKSMEELVTMSVTRDIDIIILIHYAYQVSKFHLPQVMSYWGIDRVQNISGSDMLLSYPTTKKIEAELNAVTASSKRRIYQHYENRPPFIVADGDKAYWVNFGDFTIPFINEGQHHSVFTRMALVAESSCIKGCETVSPPWWHEWNHMPSPKVCECLPWEDAFKYKIGDCSSLGNKVCGEFLQHFKNEDNFCVNFDSAPSCYVSPACAEGETTPFGRHKQCQNTAMIADKSVEELAEFAHARNMDLGVVLAHTFTKLDDYLQLPHLMYHFDIPEVKDSAGRVNLLAKEGNHKAREWYYPGNPGLLGDTYYQSSPGNQPPYMVTEGLKVYWINYGKKIVEHIYLQNGTLEDAPGLRFECTCIAGCGDKKAAAPLWHFMNKKGMFPEGFALPDY